MIAGHKERKIKEYHMAGGGYTKPREDEEIIGIPYQWHSENSYPFIEHRRNGVAYKTINALHVAIIEFEI